MSAEIDLQFGRRLRRRRRLLGLTQRQVAERVGVRFQQIQKYECGSNRISAARLWQFMDVLEVLSSYFYDDLRLKHGGASAISIAEGRAGLTVHTMPSCTNPGQIAAGASS